ncbi:nuclear transport factor 2 family protein [Phyllobacterium sp. YR531]|uniref:nuclear transport factor 2 family protein n=1 Tax=Phyllobacterium sp. YR531 TaxID=1144343 RepID=UPI00026F9853|nr:nuclear transport factor 2 family protein [Phyllobacterium sp. YR531]EJN06116.1 ketosteroid isomerase-like enzyme [Phyllobacterium sp. YR531]
MVNISEDAAIEAVINDWSQAITSKDARRTLSCLTDDIVEFSLAPPLQYSGKDADGIQGWFDTWIGNIGNEARDVHITSSGDVAFVRCLVRMTGTKTSGEKADLWFRQTLGLIKRDDIWKIAHTHASVPFYMDGSFKAAIDLTP